jgi:hypothetical protein
MLRSCSGRRKEVEVDAGCSGGEDPCFAIRDGEGRKGLYK